MDAKEKELQEREKELELKQRELAQVMDELKQRGKEVERLSKLNDEKSCELDRTMKEFNMRQKKVEIVKECIKPLEVMEKDLSLLKEAIKEFTEVEKKDEILEAEQKTKERSIQAETCKRSRVQLLAIKGSEADSLVGPAKKHKSHSHDDANKETDEEPEQIKIVDSEFHDFKKTMSSFMVGQLWALYDPKDCMPRLYAKIKRIIKFRSSLEVTWLGPIDEESVPVASGRFTYGRSGIVSHLAFSHHLKPFISGRNVIAVNPKEGETWALFRDWSESWDNNPEHYEPPYYYILD